MSFGYQGDTLYVEDLPLAELAERYGTPLYVYAQTALTEAWQAYATAFPTPQNQLCYAVKANSNLAILQHFARLGAGFDIVSEGELRRVLAAGGDPRRVVFSGMGKQAEELDFALQTGIGCFNVESWAELELLAARAVAQGKQAPVALRVNPDVDPHTHPYISTGLKQNKFGIDIGEAPAAYQRVAQLPGLRIVGVAAHIGSQLLDLSPLVAAFARLLELARHLTASGMSLSHLDLGGGLGIQYRDSETPPTPAAYAAALAPARRELPWPLWLEPGRALVGNAGILLTRVLALKATPAKQFAIVDAAMNDLLRPALYQAWHELTPVQRRLGPAVPYDVVGPICESGDFLAKDRSLCLEAGDLLAVRSAGAYGFVMSSNYNTRLRAAEVLVARQQVHLARRRETWADLLGLEYCLPETWA